MNKVVLMGRFTKDPDIRESATGDAALKVARFTLAVDRRFQKQGTEATADFISCVAFGKTAEFIEKYCNKGIKMVASGRIQTGSYTNKDGQKVYTTDVVVEEIEFAESKKFREENGDGNFGGGYGGDTGFNPDAAAPVDFMAIPTGIEGGLPFK